MDRMAAARRCWVCSNVVAPRAKWCMSCGAQTVPCRACDATNGPGAWRCHQCGVLLPDQLMLIVLPIFFLALLALVIPAPVYDMATARAPTRSEQEGTSPSAQAPAPVRPNPPIDTLRWAGRVEVGGFGSYLDLPPEVYIAIWQRATGNPDLQELVLITAGSVVNKYGHTVSAPFCNTVLNSNELGEVRRYAGGGPFARGDHSMGWMRPCFETQFLRWANEVARQTGG